MRDIIRTEDEDDFKLFCLESVADIEEQNDSQLLEFLEHLAREFQITNVYKTTDSFEGFEESLTNLLYHDKYFRDYKIIYLDASYACLKKNYETREKKCISDDEFQQLVTKAEKNCPISKLLNAAISSTATLA